MFPVIQSAEFDQVFLLVTFYVFIVHSSILFLNMHLQSGILVSPKNYLKILSVLKSVV